MSSKPLSFMCPLWMLWTSFLDWSRLEQPGRAVWWTMALPAGLFSFSLPLGSAAPHCVRVMMVTVRQWRRQSKKKKQFIQKWPLWVKRSYPATPFLCCCNFWQVTSSRFAAALSRRLLQEVWSRKVHLEEQVTICQSCQLSHTLHLRNNWLGIYKVGGSSIEREESTGLPANRCQVFASDHM